MNKSVFFFSKNEIIILLIGILLVLFFSAAISCFILNSSSNICALRLVFYLIVGILDIIVCFKMKKNYYLFCAFSPIDTFLWEFIFAFSIDINSSIQQFLYPL